MQRIRMALSVGLVLGYLASSAEPTRAQFYYEQSSSFQSVPFTSSITLSRSYSTPGIPSYYGYSQAWNNRRSAPPVHVEHSYLPESGDYYPAISSRSIAGSRQIVSSRVITSRPVVFFEPPVYVQPVVYSSAVIGSEPVFISQPVEVYGSMASPPRVTREKVECRNGHYEYEQKGTFQAFDGRRVKTYRYEYEIDQRPGRTKIKYDIDD